MKKLMVIFSMIAMLVLATVPAMAVSVDQDQFADSGDVSQSFESNVTGSYNATANNVEFDANTGNVQGQYSYIQYGDTELDD
jgi:hypothetical protein